MDIKGFIDELPEDNLEAMTVLNELSIIRGFDKLAYPVSFLGYYDLEIRNAIFWMMILNNDKLTNLGKWDTDNYSFFSYLKYFVHNGYDRVIPEEWLQFYHVGRLSGISDGFLASYISKVETERPSMEALAYLKILENEAIDKNIFNLPKLENLCNPTLHCLTAFVLLFQHEGYDFMERTLLGFESLMDIVGFINDKAADLGIVNDSDKDTLGIVLDILICRKYVSDDSEISDIIDDQDWLNDNNDYCFSNYIVYKRNDSFAALELSKRVATSVILEGSFSDEIIGIYDRFKVYNYKMFFNLMEISLSSTHEMLVKREHEISSALGNDMHSLFLSLENIS